MKIHTLLITTLLVSPMLLTGCSTSGSLAAGDDTKYVNAARGSTSAHVSSAQEEQYTRQQKIAKREIELENLKRRQTTDAITEGASAVSRAADALHKLDSLRGIF